MNDESTQRQIVGNTASTSTGLQVTAREMDARLLSLQLLILQPKLTGMGAPQFHKTIFIILKNEWYLEILKI